MSDPLTTRAAIEWRAEQYGSTPFRQKGQPHQPSKPSKAPFEPFEGSSGIGVSGIKWPEPRPLPDGLLPVAPFDMAFLPETIAPWVADISDRMQCPPDYVGVPAIIAMGSLIGRRVGVCPQAKTDWLEVPNLWGCIVGRPGMLKSPAMLEALKPLNWLEAKAREDNESSRKDYAARVELYKIRKEEAQKEARKNKSSDHMGLLLSEPEEPPSRRYIVHDATYEALGEILADNPIGTLAFRDELVSLLKTLDKEEYAAARGFFLSAWNGTGGYTFDRITRGKTHIEAACLSLLGSTQPGRIAEYMSRAIAGAAGDDGLIQRFGLLVWPDQSPEWKNTDRYPYREARETAWKVFERLDGITAESSKARTDRFDKIPYVRFDQSALAVFQEWHAELERQLRSGEMLPALESHLAKYRKLVPAVALINHIADGGAGDISETAVLRSLSLAKYLETHGRRAYSSGSRAHTGMRSRGWLLLDRQAAGPLFMAGQPPPISSKNFRPGSPPLPEPAGRRAVGIRKKRGFRRKLRRNYPNFRRAGAVGRRADLVRPGLAGRGEPARFPRLRDSTYGK
jgi:putative DNA primase/helicase